MILLVKRFRPKAFSTPYLSPLYGVRRLMKDTGFLRFWGLRHSLDRRRGPAWFARSWLILLLVFIRALIWTDAAGGATDPKSLLPTKDLPAGWILIDGPLTYTKKNLFEHIDGQAVLYIQYGFQRSVFASYGNVKTPEDQIEIDICDMGSVLQAFGIFSRFRSGGRAVGVGLDSCLDDRSMIFYKGRYFVMLYATEANSAILKEMAMVTSSKIVDSSPPPKEISLFPKDGLRPESIQYFPEGLLGHGFLGRGFQASYTDQAVHLFLAIFKSPKDATGALKTYRNHISRTGKILSGIPATFGPDAWKGEDPYKGQLIVLQRGSYLLGAAGFKDERGEVYLDKFVRNMR